MSFSRHTTFHPTQADGCRALWCAVMQLAVAELLVVADPKFNPATVSGRRAKTHARNWRDWMDGRGFREVCGFLDLDPDKTHAAILQRIAERSAR